MEEKFSGIYVQYKTRCSQFGSEYTDTKTWWSIIWCKSSFCMHQVSVVCILVTTAWYNLLGKRILLNGWSLLGWYTKVDPFLYKHVSESLILAEYQPGHFVNASVAGMSISTKKYLFCGANSFQTETSNSNFNNQQKHVSSQSTRCTSVPRFRFLGEEWPNVWISWYTFESV